MINGAFLVRGLVEEPQTDRAGGDTVSPMS